MVVSEEDVRTVALGLPETFERSSYGGQPSWRTRQRMFAWIRQDPAALVLWVSTEEEKLALVDTRPDVFFTTDHYAGQPIVLVHMASIDRMEMTEMVTDSWRIRAPRRLVRAWENAEENHSR